MSEFLKLWLSEKCDVGSGMIISNLVLVVFRSEIIFGFLFWLMCNNGCDWEELKLLELGIIFVRVDGDVSFLKSRLGNVITFHMFFL